MDKMIKMNKRGQIETFIFVIAALFVAAIILFFFNHLFDSIYTEFDDALGNSKYNGTEAHVELQEYQAATNSIWDFAFLGIAIGYVLLLVLTAYSTNISAAFYWIYIILSLVGLMIGVMLSNIWEQLATNPEFATTITRFPITNTLLGSLYPTFITFILAIFVILLFGKRGGGG